jgi:hypothetical protein
LWYKTSKDYSLERYTYSDFAGTIDERKITLGCDFHLETNLISRESKKHPMVAIYSVEEEYVATTSTSFQAL